MILALAFGALHTWGTLRFGFWIGVAQIYTFLRHLGKVLDFHGENPMTCHLTFAAEIRYRFALGDMDHDNHIGRDKQVYTYIHHAQCKHTD